MHAQPPVVRLNDQIVCWQRRRRLPRRARDSNGHSGCRCWLLIIAEEAEAALMSPFGRRRALFVLIIADFIDVVVVVVVG